MYTKFEIQVHDIHIIEVFFFAFLYFKSLGINIPDSLKPNVSCARKEPL